MILRRRTTGIVLAVFMVALWALQGWPLRIGFVTVMCMSVWEVYGAFRARGANPVRWTGLLFASLAMPSYLVFGISSIAPLTALCVMLTIAVMVMRREIDYEATVYSILPIIYPGLLIALIFPLQDLPTSLMSSVALGQAFLIALMNDLAAYEIGVKFGKRKLSPILSPKKTVEGAIGGMAASVIFAVLIPLVAQLITIYLPIAQPLRAEFPPYWQYLILGLVGGAAAQIGDLGASMVKRFCGVKDFGSIFPGHGGMMDRMDSVLCTAVVVHIYYLFFVV